MGTDSGTSGMRDVTALIDNLDRQEGRKVRRALLMGRSIVWIAQPLEHHVRVDA